MCVCLNESFCYIPETNTTLQINYTSIKYILKRAGEKWGKREGRERKEPTRLAQSVESDSSFLSVEGGYIGWSGHGEGGACWGLEKFQMLVWVVIMWCAHAKEKCTEGVHLNVFPLLNTCRPQQEVRWLYTMMHIGGRWL